MMSDSRIRPVAAWVHTQVRASVLESGAPQKAVFAAAPPSHPQRFTLSCPATTVALLAWRASESTEATAVQLLAALTWAVKPPVALLSAVPALFNEYGTVQLGNSRTSQ